MIYGLYGRVVRASDSQCRSRNCPGFDPSILRHSGGRQMKQCWISYIKKKKSPLACAEPGEVVGLREERPEERPKDAWAGAALCGPAGRPLRQQVQRPGAGEHGAAAHCWHAPEPFRWPPGILSVSAHLLCSFVLTVPYCLLFRFLERTVGKSVA